MPFHWRQEGDTGCQDRPEVRAGVVRPIAGRFSLPDLAPSRWRGRFSEPLFRSSEPAHAFSHAGKRHSDIEKPDCLFETPLPEKETAWTHSKNRDPIGDPRDPISKRAFSVSETRETCPKKRFTLSDKRNPNAFLRFPKGFFRFPCSENVETKRISAIPRRP